MRKTGKAIVLHEKDNVATMLSDVNIGDEIEVVFQKKKKLIIKALNNIPFGHKVALKDICEGEQIFKYGEVIGVAIKEIHKGEHVHIQNLKSTF
jgi:altronate dehydratase